VGDTIEIIGFAPHGVDYVTREIFRITSFRADGGIEGERWDETQQRYRPTKPFFLDPTETPGLSAGKVSIEYADDGE
jgi:hypothetical protein